MWRSTTSAPRHLLRLLAVSSTARALAKQPIHGHTQPRPSNSPAPGDAGCVESLSIDEAGRLLRPANVESPKWKLEKERKEVIAYSGLLDASISRDKVYLHPDKINESKETVDLIARAGQSNKKQIGGHISRQDKIKFLLDVFNGLKDSKEAVYGALDAWVAWEREFPLPALRIALTLLQKDEQWHRIIQVIKWMLSKGQGNTMGTYEQLIRALDKDYRAEEAHSIWIHKFGHDLHSAPWRVCELMICIYYRNNMPERLVKLFEGLERFNRKPPNKYIVQKVADAYEIMGLPEQRERVMEKYAYLFEEPQRKISKKSQGPVERKFGTKSGIPNDRQIVPLTNCQAISNAGSS